MKKVLCIAAFLVLAAQLPLWSYDTSPSNQQIIPEAIWAPATGGGTWVTEIQILSLASTAADVFAYFDVTGGTTVGPFLVSSGLTQFHSARSANILSTLDALDSSSFVYYGKVGALWFETSNINSLIQVQAKTVNGNYGKTFPGLNIIESNTAAEGRPMVFLDLVQNAKYRTFVGAYNTSSTATYVVRFQIINGNNVQVGSLIDKTLAPFGFISFNPFTEAAAPAGNYENCWLTVDVLSGGSDFNGVMCFGSIANNYTNDTYALIARMWN